MTRFKVNKGVGIDLSMETGVRTRALVAAEGVIFEALFAHALRHIKIAAVDHQLAGHEFSGAIPIELAENIPLSANQGGIRVLQGPVSIIMVMDLRKEGLAAWHAFVVGGMHDGPFFAQALDNCQRGREADGASSGVEHGATA